MSRVEPKKEVINKESIETKSAGQINQTMRSHILAETHFFMQLSTCTHAPLHRPDLNISEKTRFRGVCCFETNVDKNYLKFTAFAIYQSFQKLTRFPEIWRNLREILRNFKRKQNNSFVGIIDSIDPSEVINQRTSNAASNDSRVSAKYTWSCGNGSWRQAESPTAANLSNQQLGTTNL